MKTITMPALSDYHVHLRQGPAIAAVAPYSARCCGRILAMPNLTPPVADAQSLVAYREQLRPHLPGVDVLLAFKLLPTTTSFDIDMLADAGAIAGKLYPGGVTTHSADGIPAEWLNCPDTATSLGDVLERMQARRLVLCLHGEMPNQDDPLLREPAFLPFVAWAADRYPRLRIVLEHISTQEAVRFVSASRPGVAATITLHHLMVHLGHLLGSATSAAEAGLGYGDGKLHPHLYCWPCPKRPADREALRRAALSGSDKFFLGSDSAPHPRGQKESDCGCAGVFSAPVLAEGLAQFFDDHDALDRLVGFTSTIGDAFYGLRPTGRAIRLIKRPWSVPQSCEDYSSFLAGRTIRWQMS